MPALRALAAVSALPSSASEVASQRALTSLAISHERSINLYTNSFRFSTMSGNDSVPVAHYGRSWSPREAEILAVALRLLRDQGYARLTLEAVASCAKASKATIYRRWPTKTALVLAAFRESLRFEFTAPRSGTLRGDLIQVGRIVCVRANEHAGTIRAFTAEESRDPKLADAVRRELLEITKRLISEVFQSAVDRNEIADSATASILADVLLGYLVYRSVLTVRRPNEHTVEILVDEMIMPSLRQS